LADDEVALRRNLFEKSLMIIHTRQRKIVFLLAFHAFAWSASLFFSHAAFTGERGLNAKQEAKIRMEHASEKFALLKAERKDWERRVSQLSGPIIDQDLLDERLRAVLNTAHKNDLVILVPKD
jgi:cell division protein FtsB